LRSAEANGEARAVPALRIGGSSRPAAAPPPLLKWGTKWGTLTKSSFVNASRFLAGLPCCWEAISSRRSSQEQHSGNTNFASQTDGDGSFALDLQGTRVAPPHLDEAVFSITAFPFPREIEEEESRIQNQNANGNKVEPVYYTAVALFNTRLPTTAACCAR
jgi:hypothetical protein